MGEITMKQSGKSFVILLDVTLAREVLCGLLDQLWEPSLHFHLITMTWARSCRLGMFTAVPLHADPGLRGLTGWIRHLWLGPPWKYHCWIRSPLFFASGEEAVFSTSRTSELELDRITYVPMTISAVRVLLEYPDGKLRAASNGCRLFRFIPGLLWPFMSWCCKS